MEAHTIRRIKLIKNLRVKYFFWSCAERHETRIHWNNLSHEQKSHCLNFLNEEKNLDPNTIEGEKELSFSQKMVLKYTVNKFLNSQKA